MAAASTVSARTTSCCRRIEEGPRLETRAALLGRFAMELDAVAFQDAVLFCSVAYYTFIHRPDVCTFIFLGRA